MAVGEGKTGEKNESSEDEQCSVLSPSSLGSYIRNTSGSYSFPIPVGLGLNFDFKMQVCLPF